MSGIGATNTASSSTPAGTNVPPVSFPGIASGIDYNSIIQKYTDITLAQEKPLQTKVTSLTNQQSELLKIQDLVLKFQDSFAAVSDPGNFSATSPTSSNTGAIAASSIPGATATPGSYVIKSATLATSTQILNDKAANGPFSDTTALASAGASITPVNAPPGSSNKGQITIDGVAIAYDVNADTLQSFIARANTALSSAGIAASLASDGAGHVTVTSAQPLTLGSASDSGNLLAVLKLDTAQVTFGGGNYTATSTSNIGGINLGATFNTGNNAGFATAVTSGKFSINGVVFNVSNSGNNLSDVLKQINGSSAGVTATYDAANDRVLLTAKAAGPQGISIGGAGDTSNFLQAVGFLTDYTKPNQVSAGAAVNVGKSAHVQYVDNAGSAHDVYSNTNDVTTVVPGVDLKLQQAVDGVTIPPVTITVSSDSSGLQTAIKTWTAAYNAVIDEINTSTQAPVVGSSQNQSTGQTSSSQLTTGGVLFNNQDVLSLRDRLINIVTSFGNTGSTSYNSLSSVGLVLDSSFTVATASAGSTSNTTSQTSVSQQTFAGTSGRLKDLDTTKLANALAANPNAVAKLFTGTTSVIGTLGVYLSDVSGLSTQLTGALAGKGTTNSLFKTLQNQTTDQITSFQQQIKLVTDQANLQADRLRQQFVSSEASIAELQSLQSSLGALTASTTVK